MTSVWRVDAPDPQRARALAGALGVHPLTAQVLLNRGLAEPSAAQRFLQPGLETLSDPAALEEMDRAVERLRLAVARREPITIFGDSDVDGLTASVILYEVLEDLGAVVRARVSNRIAGGYGLPDTIVRSLAHSSTRLLVLVDCGTNQPEAIAQLAACGIDTIIVDHHVPLAGWAKPHALINPYRSQGAGRELCSAGLAFKLAEALIGRTPPLETWLDLAALGTLADCSPLVGDSRAIVVEGMARLMETQRPGLRELCQATDTTVADPERILRRLTPRLNASGRLGDATAVWHLLRRTSDTRLSAHLEENQAAHATTKQLQRQIIMEAEEQVQRQHFRDQYVMVVSRSGWHQGLMGPLAAQLAQRYGRPTIAIAMHETQGTGSGRSIPLFNLLDALKACQDVLMRFGGHAQACGLTVGRGQLEMFRAQVNTHARQALGSLGLVRTRRVDLELTLDAVESGWVQEMERFAPFGQGNPRPTMVIRRVRVEVRSPRLGALMDGTSRLSARGSFADLGSEQWYDVVASPTMVNDEVVLAVSEVRELPQGTRLPSVAAGL